MSTGNQPYRAHPPDLAVIPMESGRRLAAKMIDVAIYLVVGGLVFAVMRRDDATSASILIVSAIIGGLITVAVLAVKSVTPGQVLLGARHIDAVTGRRAPGGAALKYLVEYVILIGPLIAALTMRGPMNRSVFDRMAGLILIDLAASRALYEAPSSPDEHEPAHDTGSAANAPAPAGGSANPAPAAGAAWGAAITPAEPAAFPQAGPAAAAPEEEDDELAMDETRIVVLDPERAAGRDSSTALCFDDGQTLYLDQPYVVGRNPSAPEGFDDAASYRVHDPDRSISQTHMVVGPTPDGVWLIDIRSTNGVRVKNEDRTITIPSGQRHQAHYGDVVHFGNRSFTVKRPPADPGAIDLRKADRGATESGDSSRGDR